MTKYDFSNNNHEEIDLPGIIKINKSLISITHASGTDYKNIPDEGNLEIQIGNIGSYDPPSPDPEPIPDPQPDPDPDPTQDGDGIILHITNNLNTEVRLSGKVVLNVGKNTNSWDNVENATQVEANMVSDSANDHTNNISIQANGGEYTSRLMQTTKIYNGDIYLNGVKIQLGSPSYSELINGNWNILGIQNPVNSSMPIYLYSAFEYGNAAPNDSSHTRNVAHSSSSMYIASIPDSTSILNGKTFNLNIIGTMLLSSGNTMTIKPDMTGYYVIL